MTEKEYRAYEAINYSTLSSLDRDPSLVGREIKPTDSMTLGSLVDNLITRGEFGDEYKVAQYEKPTGQMGTFCDGIIAGLSEQEAYNAVGFKRDKLLAVMDKFNSGDGANYCKEVMDNADKTFVPFEMIAKANTIVATLKEHPNTSSYFQKNLPEGIEIKFQVPIIFNLPNNLGKGKALLDLVLIDHINKNITPIDLKTTSGKTSEFKSSFMKWKYYIQASLYSYGLKQCCIADSPIDDYEVLPFKFIVISTTDSGKPIVWKCTNKDLMVGMMGGTSSTGYHIRGFIELAETLNWHYQADLWDYTRDVYEGNGEIELNNFETWV
jgi:hypothetical protein